MVYIKSYIFNYFYKQYLVLLTMVSRNSNTVSVSSSRSLPSPFFSLSVLVVTQNQALLGVTKKPPLPPPPHYGSCLGRRFDRDKG